MAKRFIMNSGCYAAMVMGPVGRIEEAMSYLDEAERTAEELDLIWVLPWVLASRARWSDDPEVAAKALDQAQGYVFSGRVTYPFEFYYVGIDAALKHKDWTRAETYCEKMQAYYNEIKLRAGQLKVDFVEADVADDFDKILSAYLIKRARMK